MLNPEERKRLFSPVPTVFKQDTKRKCKTQPLAKAILTLRGTVLPQEERTHFYVAEAPLEAGLNPLLLVIDSPSGEREFRNVLAILPTWKIHTDPCTSDLYRAALGCVRAKYRTLITELSSSNLGKTLPVEVVDGRHCGNSVPSWLAKPLDSLLDDAAQNDTSPRLISEVRELLLCKPDNDPGVVPWSVLHLHSHKPDASADPDWFIFEKWDDWAARGLSSAECFAEFSGHHKKPENPKAFNSHLNYLGLPVPLKPGIKRRRERNWRHKTGLREKAASS